MVVVNGRDRQITVLLFVIAGARGCRRLQVGSSKLR